jgi:hypothetical protein
MASSVTVTVVTPVVLLGEGRAPASRRAEPGEVLKDVDLTPTVERWIRLGYVVEGDEGPGDAEDQAKLEAEAAERKAKAEADEAKRAAAEQAKREKAEAAAAKKAAAAQKRAEAAAKKKAAAEAKKAAAAAKEK